MNSQPISPMKIRRPIVELLDTENAESLQSHNPGERLAVAFGIFDTARLMLSGTLRQQHPDWTEERIQQEVAKRLPLASELGDAGSAPGTPPAAP